MTAGESAPATTSRRRFLRRLGLGAATVLVAGDSLLAFRAYNQGVLAEGNGPAFEALDRWQDFEGPEAAVAAAVLAASAHNTQPWLFEVTDDRIDLYADRARTTGANDPLLREFWTSLGCALENLVLGARANGFTTEVTLDPGTAPDLVASVGLEPASPVEDELYRAIGDRRSNRSEYGGDPLPAATLEAMSALVDGSVAPAELRWLDADPARRRFGELLVEGAEAHGADDEQSRASFEWWRSDWDEIQEGKDGLNIDGVGLSPLIRTLGKILPATDRGAADEVFLERTEIQAESAAAFGLVTVDDPYALSEQLAGGRLLQRLHLWATAHDLGFQHMNQATERLDRDREQGRASAFEGPLDELAGPGLLAAFRIGQPSVDALPSPRRPIAEVLR